MIVATRRVDHGPRDYRHFLIFLRFSATHLGPDHAGTNTRVLGDVASCAVIVDVIQLFWKGKKTAMWYPFSFKYGTDNEVQKKDVHIVQWLI